MQTCEPPGLGDNSNMKKSSMVLSDEDKRMLLAMRHGLDSSVFAELKSEMAQHICGFSIEYLDKLIAKHSEGPAILKKQNVVQAALCRDMHALLQNTAISLENIDQELALIDHEVANQESANFEELDALHNRINALLEKLAPLLFGEKGSQLKVSPEKLDELLRQLVSSVKVSEDSFLAAIEQRLEKHQNLVQSKVVVTREKMESYLKEKFPERGSIKITSFLEVPGGSSKTTLLMEVKGFDNQDITPLVVRLDREAGSTDTHVLDEAPTLRVMRKLDLPVPEVLWQEPDTSKIGLAFIVVRKVDAKLGGGMWHADKSLCNAETALDLARLLAKLHTLDVEKYDLRGALNSDPKIHPMQGLIENIRSLWRMKKMKPDGLLEACLCWLEQNMPEAPDKPALIHADVSFHNIMIRDYKIACLLDWELSHLGDPNEDLSYCRPCVEQLISWEDFMAEYRNHGGIEYSEESGRYYGIWRHVRNLIYTETSGRSFHSGANPDFRWGFFHTYYRMEQLNGAEKVAEAGAFLSKQEKNDEC